MYEIIKNPDMKKAVCSITFDPNKEAVKNRIVQLGYLLEGEATIETNDDALIRLLVSIGGHIRVNDDKQGAV